MKSKAIKYCLMAIAMSLPFLTKAQNNSYQKQLTQYRKGTRDTAFLRKLAAEALEQKDTLQGQQVIKSLIAQLNIPADTAQIALISRYNTGLNSPAFQFLLKNREKADQLMGDKFASYALQNTIIHVIFEPTATGIHARPDWKKLKAAVKPYGAFGQRIYWQVKSIFHQQRGQWPPMAAAYQQYYLLAKTDILFFQLNEMAWKVFKNTSDLKSLQWALEWSTEAVGRLDPDHDLRPNFMDTQANLLYSTGKKSAAIALERDALALAIKLQKPTADYEKTLDNMTKNAQ